MKCPKAGCSGVMYRFRPKHHVSACHRAVTGVQLELTERKWKQVGFMCGVCGFMEFYAEGPEKVVLREADFFERTEPQT